VAKRRPEAETYGPGPGRGAFHANGSADKNGFLELNGWGTVSGILSPNGSVATARMTAKGLALSDLAARLGQRRHRPIIDKTGLAGRYDFMLQYTIGLTGAAPADNASDPVPTSLPLCNSSSG
jgi:uncharacterized protein (TIGR03435 family)